MEDSDKLIEDLQARVGDLEARVATLEREKMEMRSKLEKVYGELGYDGPREGFGRLSSLADGVSELLDKLEKRIEALEPKPV